MEETQEVRAEETMEENKEEKTKGEAKEDAKTETQSGEPESTADVLLRQALEFQKRPLLGRDMFIQPRTRAAEERVVGLGGLVTSILREADRLREPELKKQKSLEEALNEQRAENAKRLLMGRPPSSEEKKSEVQLSPEYMDVSHLPRNELIRRLWSRGREESELDPFMEGAFPTDDEIQEEIANLDVHIDHLNFRPIKVSFSDLKRVKTAGMYLPLFCLPAIRSLPVNTYRLRRHKRNRDVLQGRAWAGG